MREINPLTYYGNLRNEMLEYIPKHCNRLLEVGCGQGRFGKLLKSAGYPEVWGVEYNPIVGEIAKEFLDNVIIGDFNEIYKDLPKNYFDCIIFNDVLEHFNYPEDVLKEIYLLGSNDFFVVCSIPNVRYIGNLYELLIKKDWKYKEDGILDNTHFRFFTKKSIRRMFLNTGYEVLQIKGINSTNSFKLKLINIMFFNFLEDLKFLEFAVVAKGKNLNHGQ